MEKLKILIQHTNMPCGGVETSIANFIKLFSKDHEIDLSLLSTSGPMLERVQKDISIYNSGARSNKYYSYERLNKKHSIVFRICRKILRQFYKLRSKESLVRSKIDSNSPQFQKTYDVAISFYAHSFDENYVVLNMLKAKVKLAYIHMDLLSFPISPKTLKQLDRFDKILCVSQECMEQFINIYPNLKNKVDFLYNTQDLKEISIKAETKVKLYSEKYLNFVTIARVAPMKAQLRTARVVKRLLANGHNFIWHVVGDGPDFLKLKNYVEKNKLGDNIKLIGFKSNPYPFLQQADLMLAVSAFGEACPMVYAESMTLSVPVVSTDTLSAHEILDNWGFVCKNSEEDIFQCLNKILKDPSVISIKKNKLKNYKFDNEAIKQKFYSLVEYEK